MEQGDVIRIQKRRTLIENKEIICTIKRFSYEKSVFTRSDSMYSYTISD